MAVRPKRLVDGTTLGTGTSTLYTTPTGKTTRITSFSATNIDGGSADTITVHLVPSGDTADNSNKVAAGINVDTNETLPIAGSIGQIIEAGGSIQASSGSGSIITVVVSGFEVTV